LSDADAGGAWSSGNTAIATIDGASGIATGVTAGNVTITYTLGTGCLTTAVLKVMPLPVADYFVKEDICPGEDVPLALISSGVGVVDYIWDFSGATIVTASSNHGGPYILKWSATGVYTISLVAVSSAGCSSLPFVDTIKVHDYPDAGIGPIAYLNNKSAALCIGDSVLMQASTNLGMYKYEWFPAPFFRYWVGNRVVGAINAPGYITLLVTDPFGCQARDSVFVDAQPCCEVFFPTAFTPNGDGKNDVFRVAGLGHHQLDQFRVVNRWGQSVFETVNEITSWDGTYNGVPQDMGVYYYVFTYDCEGKSKTLKGDVTLIR
jgi:gliding motility-associated-like protein